MIPRVLVDTNVFLSLLREENAGSSRIFLEPREYRFLFSHASAWEISIKYGIGKLQLPDAPELFLPERLRQARFEHLAIELQHVLRVHSLPQIHRDPFDRLLISQAIIEDIVVLTNDKLFLKYEVKTVTLADLSR